MAALVTIYQSDNDIEAQIIGQLLTEAGIPVVGYPISRQPVYHWLQMRVPQFRVQVFPADAERARTLVQEYQRQVAHGEVALVTSPAETGHISSCMTSIRKVGQSCLAIVLALCALLALAWFFLQSK